MIYEHIQHVISELAYRQTVLISIWLISDMSSNMMNIVQCTVMFNLYIARAMYISYRVTGLYRLCKTCYLHSLLCNNSIIAQFSVQ